MDDPHEAHPEPATPQMAIKTIDDVEQLRALSDPLRLRILEALGGPPRTTKQVADRLGEKPTRLYHHVDALESAGLVRLIYTRPKRGTLEKYYQTVARQFRADSSLFPRTAGAGDEDSWQAAGARVLETSAAELRRRGAEEPAASESDDDEIPALIAHLKIRAARGSMARIQQRLEELVSELQELDEGDDGTEEAFGLTLALYPDDATFADGESSD